MRCFLLRHSCVLLTYTHTHSCNPSRNTFPSHPSNLPPTQQPTCPWYQHLSYVTLKALQQQRVSQQQPLEKGGVSEF
jgi:hypothetical protein